MNRREKELRSLSEAERELRETAITRLTEVSAGRDSLFFSTEGRWSSPDGMDILSKARELRRRSEELGEQISLATEIISAFEHANDLADHHRLGPIRLAQNLLDRIQLQVRAMESISEGDDRVASVTGPVEKRDGQLLLRIPLDVGGKQLVNSARGISSVAGGFLELRIPDWLAEKLGIGEGSLVDVDNANGKFNLAPHDENSS